MADDLSPDSLGSDYSFINLDDVVGFGDTITIESLSYATSKPTIDYSRLGGNIQANQIPLAIGDLIEHLKSTKGIDKNGKEVYWIPPDWHLWYGPAYPDQLIRSTGGGRTGATPHEKASNLISYKTVKQCAASIDEQPFTGRRPKKPRIRGTSSDKEGRTYVEKSKWLDVLYQFDCFSKSNVEVEALITYFEDTLEYFAGLFTELGAQRWMLWDRVIDNNAERIASDKEMNVRSFQLYARTEKFYITPTETIQQIISEFLIRLGAI